MSSTGVGTSSAAAAAARFEGVVVQSCAPGNATFTAALRVSAAALGQDQLANVHVLSAAGFSFSSTYARGAPTAAPSAAPDAPQADPGHVYVAMGACLAGMALILAYRCYRSHFRKRLAAVAPAELAGSGKVAPLPEPDSLPFWSIFPSPSHGQHDGENGYDVSSSSSAMDKPWALQLPPWPSSAWPSTRPVTPEEEEVDSQLRAAGSDPAAVLALARSLVDRFDRNDRYDRDDRDNRRNNRRRPDRPNQDDRNIDRIIDRRKNEPTVAGVTRELSALRRSRNARRLRVLGHGTDSGVSDSD